MLLEAPQRIVGVLQQAVAEAADIQAFLITAHLHKQAHYSLRVAVVEVAALAHGGIPALLAAVEVLTV